jgi:hypothetical protein
MSSQTGTSSTSEVLIKKTQGGVVKTMTQTTVNYYRSSRLFRCGLAVYLSFFLTSQLVGTYQDGKHALLEYRATHSSGSPNKEWEAAKKGCQDNSWCRFWGSVFWPGHIWSNIMPGIIVSMNKAT